MQIFGILKLIHSLSLSLFLISAMVVRFITRRFIGEYDPNLEKIYSFSTIIDNEMILFEILDAAGQLNVSNYDICILNEW